MNEIEVRNILGRKHVYVNGELVHRETEQDSEEREYWCVCKKDGSVKALQESLKEGLTPAQVLFGEETVNEDFYCYKITLLEYNKVIEERKKNMADAKKTRVTPTPFVDRDFVKGKREIQGKIENGIVMEKLEDGTWVEYQKDL